MRCPVCHQAIPEQAPQCVHCGFHLAQADRIFGSAAVLDPTLNDIARVLSEKEKQRVLKQIDKLEHRFPQVRFSIVTTRLPATVPFAGYMFWLFNRGNLAPQLEQGPQCRLILLGLDANLQRAFCMIGYGLEPFVPEPVVQEFADSTLPALSAGDYFNAITTALETMEARLTAIAEALPKIYGIEGKEGLIEWWSDAFLESWKAGQVRF